jgi:hypothetical protein
MSTLTRNCGWWSLSAPQPYFRERADTAAVTRGDERGGFASAVGDVEHGGVPGHQPQPRQERPGHAGHGLDPAEPGEQRR